MVEFALITSSISKIESAVFYETNMKVIADHLLILEMGSIITQFSMLMQSDLCHKKSTSAVQTSQTVKK